MKMDFSKFNMFKYVFLLTIAMVYVASQESNNEDFLDEISMYNETEIVKHIQYFLYTRDVENAALIYRNNTPELLSSGFAQNKSTKILFHGRNGYPESMSNVLIRAMLLTEYDVNVIVVDWTWPATGNISTVISRVPIVGRDIAGFLSWISQLSEGPAPRMHLIGFSQGAHLAAIAARHANFTVDFITALDPAGEGWGPGSERIKSTDANYVEVMHTTAGSIGLVDAVGDTDFYPNGGKVMPGCSIPVDNACSHLRAVHYYADSIDHRGFMAERCKTVDEAMTNQCSNLGPMHMGGAFPKNATGVYYVATNERRPYHRYIFK